MTVAENQFIPHMPHPRQMSFLAIEGGEAMFGGAARGGKTEALLMAALQYAEVPGYGALILRRSFRDLHLQGGIIPRSKEWLSSKAKYSETHKRWTFPSGATLTFGYLDADDDVYQYQGTSFQYIGFDELTQFTEFSYRYMSSRLSPDKKVKVPLRLRSATNPGGVGHEWVYNRFINQKTKDPNAIFVPSKLVDNPSVDALEYTNSLSRLDPMTRAQLLEGDWSAFDGGRFRKEWFRRFVIRGQERNLQEGFLRIPDPGVSNGFREEPFSLAKCPVFMTVDPAASSKSSADFTVISVWAVTPSACLLWLDCIRVQREIPDIVPLIQENYLKWKPGKIGIESVASNTAVFQLACRAHSPALPVMALSPRGKDKLVRATPAITIASQGRIFLPTRDTNPSFPIDEVIDELARFSGDAKNDGNDDIVDTLSYAVHIMFSTPDFRGTKAKPMVLDF